MGNGMNKVLPGVYIGNFRDSKDPEQLQANNITHIISIHDTARKLHEDKEYLCIQASDTPGQNLSQFFSQSNDFIHHARMEGGNVLIHWNARGYGRSSRARASVRTSRSAASCWRHTTTLCGPWSPAQAYAGARAPRA